MHVTLDWMALFTAPGRVWLQAGLLTTLAVTIVAGLLASALAIVLVGLRVQGGWLRWPAVAVISVFRNTPLLVQLFFWYFAAWAALPRAVKIWVNADHPWLTLPMGISLMTPEFLSAAWGLAVFSAAFMAEEVRAGLAAVPKGQTEAALAQGFGRLQLLRYVLLPQGLANAWQPLVGQYLNLMKLSSLASAIGLAEITYAARQIESYNAHALEAFAAATVLYLLIGAAMSRLLLAVGPRRPRRTEAAVAAQVMA